VALLVLDRVSFAYDGTPVLSDVSLTLQVGEAVALVGPNGSGKTTLLKLLLGLVRPGSGEARLDGRPLRGFRPRELARRLAYVPQVHREAFPFTVRDVVQMGRLPHRGFLEPLGPRDLAAAEEAMEELGIAALADRPYTAVSGGERQLTLLARAVAQEARVLVMDEPTNGLDYGNQLRLLERIAELGRRGRTVVFSSHHPDHALTAADRVVMLRGGRVVADGPAEETITAESLRLLYGVDVRLVQAGREVAGEHPWQ